MNVATQRRIHEYVAAFFEGDVDYEGWHASQHVPVPKKATFPIQTNGAVSCSWMFAARFFLPS